MFGRPKRNTKNVCCGSKGRCSCQRRNNAAIARRPDAAPRACSVTLPNGKVCGKTVRGGVCPSPDH
jgi:hypothetical protein